MLWIFLCFLSCQAFYYEDDITTELEVAKVTSSYNIGIARATASSVKILLYKDGFSAGHGSGNLFKIGSARFVITATHVIEGEDAVVIKEANGNMIPARVAWANLHNDIAILVPLDEFQVTEPVSYRNSKQKDLTGEHLWYYGYPSNFAGLLINGFVSQSRHSRVIMQSQAWFGASGSATFDSSGRIIGIVHAISLEIDPWSSAPTYLDTVVIVNRVFDLDRRDVLGILRNDSKSWNSD